MKKTFGCILVLICFVSVVKSQSTIKISEIVNTRVIDTSAGNYFGKTRTELKNEQYFFFVGNYRYEPTYAWINIDGKDIKLKQITSRVTGNLDKDPTWIATYKAGNIVVLVKMKRPKECDVDFCFIADITITKGKLKKTIKTIRLFIMG